MTPIRVLLVDDHTVLRAGVRMLVNAQDDMTVVGEAANSSAAFAEAVRAPPDVVILDLTLPGGASLPVIEELRKRDVPARVLVLTMHDDAAYVRAALAAGAGGYVVKTVSEQDLVQAIRDVARGRMVVDLDDDSATASVFQSLLQTGKAGLSGARPSPREQEVLSLLGQGFTNQAIAEQLDVSPKTIATYRARLAEKLGLKTTADFVRYAVDMGLVAPADNRP